MVNILTGFGLKVNGNGSKDNNDVGYHADSSSSSSNNNTNNDNNTNRLSELLWKVYPTKRQYLNIGI